MLLCMEHAFRLLKNSRNASLVSGHGFSSADKPLYFDFGKADLSPTSRSLSTSAAYPGVQPIPIIEFCDPERSREILFPRGEAVLRLRSLAS
jgi:hypothetical protein